MTKIKVHIVIGISTYNIMPVNQSTTNRACKNMNFNNLHKIFSLWRGKIIRGLMRSRISISVSRNKSAQNASSTFGSFKQQSIFFTIYLY